MKSKTRQLRISVTIVVVIVGLILGWIVIGLTYTPVDHGTVALIKRFGGLTGVVYEPGLNWRTPFVDQVVVVPTVLQSYETSDDPGASGADFRDYPVNAQTIDGQQITIKYTVLFRIPSERAVFIVQNVGVPRMVAENIVKARSRNLTRLLAQSHTAEDLYSGEGIFDYEKSVQNALSENFKKYGVVLDDFLVRKVEFDDEYINAIEQQQIAQEAIETAKYRADAAEHEKARQIRLAEAEAERIKLMAKAEAEKQQLMADAEAYGIKVRGEMLKENPELVQWEFVRNLENVKWGIMPGESLETLMPLPSFEEQDDSSLLPETPGENEESDEGGNE